jgi:surface protein
MFTGATTFNRNLSNWNTGAVTAMGGMFRNAAAFNNGCAAGVSTCPLPWNTAAVTTMSNMFNGATSFNQDLGGWNTASVSVMSSMFNGATSFNQDIGGWSTGSVYSWAMGQMFNGATAFNQDLSGWCVTNVTSAPSQFATGAGFASNTALHPVWGTCPP